MRMLCAFLLISNSAYPVFDHYQAARAYQEGDFQKAQELYSQQLLTDPYNGQTLYNLGDASYRLEQYDRARAYFLQAAQQLGNNPLLQERAYYNAGNSYFFEQQLEEALEQYKKALELNPDNERTLHNKHVVEELLKQREQQQQEKERREKQENNECSNSDQNNQSEQNKQEQQDKEKDKSEESDDAQQSDKHNEQSSDENEKPSDATKSDSGSQSESSSDTSGEKQADGSNAGDKKEDSEKDNQQKNGKQDRNKAEQEQSDQTHTNQGKEKSDRMSQEAQKNQSSDDKGAESKNGSGAENKTQTDRDKKEKREQSKEHKKSSHTASGQQEKSSMTDVQEQPRGQDGTETHSSKQKGQQRQQPLRAQEVETADSSDLDKNAPEYNLMKYLENEEENASRKMLKTIMKQEMPESHGQKNW